MFGSGYVQLCKKKGEAGGPPTLGSDAYEMITSGLFFLSVFQKSGRQSILTIHILLILN